jgi:hypothetical protein
MWQILIQAIQEHSCTPSIVDIQCNLNITINQVQLTIYSKTWSHFWTTISLDSNISQAHVLKRLIGWLISEEIIARNYMHHQLYFPAKSSLCHLTISSLRARFQSYTTSSKFISKCNDKQSHKEEVRQCIFPWSFTHDLIADILYFTIYTFEQVQSSQKIQPCQDLIEVLSPFGWSCQKPHNTCINLRIQK